MEFGFKGLGFFGGSRMYSRIGVSSSRPGDYGGFKGSGLMGHLRCFIRLRAEGGKWLKGRVNGFERF